MRASRAASILLALALTGSLSACGEESAEVPVAPMPPAASSPAAAPSDVPSASPSVSPSAVAGSEFLYRYTELCITYPQALPPEEPASFPEFDVDSDTAYNVRQDVCVGSAAVPGRQKQLEFFEVLDADEREYVVADALKSEPGISAQASEVEGMAIGLRAPASPDGDFGLNTPDSLRIQELLAYYSVLDEGSTALLTYRGRALSAAELEEARAIVARALETTPDQVVAEALD